MSLRKGVGITGIRDELGGSKTLNVTKKQKTWQVRKKYRSIQG